MLLSININGLFFVISDVPTLPFEQLVNNIKIHKLPLLFPL